MKKVWLIVAMAALFGTTISTFADVQNIRLSGDIRIRGYYTVNHDGFDNDGDIEQAENTDSYISQRTRVTIEADLEDHVLVVVTLKAEGLWGAANESTTTAGAGLGDSGTEDDDEDGIDPQIPGRGDNNDFPGYEHRINRLWDLGITEAYIQFNEMFYSAATLKLGRQYLHYGRGLIISSVEQEYNYDAARVVWDAYPLTIDLVYALLAEQTPFGGTSFFSDFGDVAPNDVHMVFANARYEMSDSVIKDIEVYFGWIVNSRGGDENGSQNFNSPLSSFQRIPPTGGSIGIGGASPMIVGVRGDLNLTENLETWFEGAYEFGPDGEGAFNESISAYIANIGARFTFKDVQMTPAINANVIYASGGGSDNEHSFRPWFDYQDGYSGAVFSPILSNIIILNAGVSAKVNDQTTVAVQGYYYYAVDDDSHNASNLNVDNGGLGILPTIVDNDLGWEVDGIVTYDYSKDVRFQLVGGMFVPGNSFSEDSDYSARVATEIRLEVSARF